MKMFVGFDDTDHIDALYGTGKVVRWFQKALPVGCISHGVVRQQLLIDDSIPYTSHNSAACLIVEVPDQDFITELTARAVAHIEKYAVDGSDPGLCIASEDDPSITTLTEFGFQCTRSIATQKHALEITSQVHLSGHGGTNDGIIGAAAAVGLTASGWSGRFIAFGDLRTYPSEMMVSDLIDKGICVVAMERDAQVPGPGDTVLTNGWLRPRLIGHQPVLFVQCKDSGVWENLYFKRRKAAGHSLHPKAVVVNT
jgi:tRNA(Ile2) C34 agmatinyltransferase TiaS